MMYVNIFFAEHTCRLAHAHIVATLFVGGGECLVLDNLFDLLDLLETNERTSGEGRCLE